MSEYTFKEMDPQETETAVGKNFNPDSPYAANSIYFPGRDTPIAGCPAPRKIIADTGAAVVGLETYIIKINKENIRAYTFLYR